jgi:hypothetical protein
MIPHRPPTTSRLGFAGGGKGGDLLMADMQPFHVTLRAATDGIGKAVQAVAHNAPHAADTGGMEGFDHLICNGGHDISFGDWGV